MLRVKQALATYVRRFGSATSCSLTSIFEGYCTSYRTSYSILSFLAFVDNSSQSNLLSSRTKNSIMEGKTDYEANLGMLVDSRARSNAHHEVAFTRLDLSRYTEEVSRRRRLTLESQEEENCPRTLNVNARNSTRNSPSNFLSVHARRA